MTNLGQIIKRLRNSAGFTPSYFAKQSGLSLAYIMKLEEGQIKNVTLKTSKALANGFQMDLKDFLEEIGYLKETKRPSISFMATALRKDGYTEEQARQILAYARFLKGQGKGNG